MISKRIIVNKIYLKYFLSSLVVVTSEIIIERIKSRKLFIFKNYLTFKFMYGTIFDFNLLLNLMYFPFNLTFANF